MVARCPILLDLSIECAAPPKLTSHIVGFLSRVTCSGSHNYVSN